MNGSPMEHVTVASNLERAIVPRVCKPANTSRLQHDSIEEGRDDMAIM